MRCGLEDVYVLRVFGRAVVVEQQCDIMDLRELIDLQFKVKRYRMEVGCILAVVKRRYVV